MRDNNLDFNSYICIVCDWTVKAENFGEGFINILITPNNEVSFVSIIYYELMNNIFYFTTKLQTKHFYTVY